MERATRECSLTTFIEYAVQGFHDGLEDLLNTIKASQIQTTWDHQIYTLLDTSKVKGKTKKVIERRRRLILAFHPGKPLSIDDMFEIGSIVREYVSLTQTTLKRDLDYLIDLELLTKDKDLYSLNLGILKSALPRKKPGAR